MISIREKAEHQVRSARIANRLLVIQRHLEDFFEVDCRRVGNNRPRSKDKKYGNVLYLGLVLVTYRKMYGNEVYPTPYTVYAEVLGRNRTTGYHWLRLARNQLDVYPKLQAKYKQFLNDKLPSITRDAKTLDAKKNGGFVTVCLKIDEKKFDQSQQIH
jgi:hypothetical protein